MRESSRPLSSICQSDKFPPLNVMGVREGENKHPKQKQNTVKELSIVNKYNEFFFPAVIIHRLYGFQTVFSPLSLYLFHLKAAIGWLTLHPVQ